jgi:hypothetical protein
MQWLEVIKLRSAGNCEKVLEILRTIARSAQGKGLVKIRIYRHGALERDLSLHLYWESDQPVQKASPLGHQLVQIVKEFGLIDHSLWIEEK